MNSKSSLFIFLFWVFISMIGQNFSFAEAFSDQITTRFLPNEHTGIIPEDIIYIQQTERFYAYGNGRLVIIEYSSVESKYIVTGHIDLFDNTIAEDNLYGNNIFPKFEVTRNTPANKYLAYNEVSNELYVL